MAQKEMKRIYSFDILRIVAVCAVVMIHISADFIKEYDNNTMEFIWGNVFSALSRFAVPVFLMISGALMLDTNRDISTKKIMKSTVGILVLIFSWSFIYTLGYNVLRPLVFNEPLCFSDIINTFFNGHYHMWYLYVLVGLYLITPLLRCFVKKENAGLVRGYLVFSVIIYFVVLFVNELLNGCLNQENILVDFVGNFRLNYIYEYIVYYILGWYIVNIGFEKSTRVVIYISGIVGLITTFVGTHIHFGNGYSDYFTSNNSLNVFLYSLTVFVFVHYLFENKNLTLGIFWIKTSRLTFGVYLIHCIFLFALKIVCDRIDIVVFEILATFIACVVVSFVSVFIISKIPLVKKLVRE